MIAVIEVHGKLSSVQKAVKILGMAVSASGLHVQGLLTYDRWAVGSIKISKVPLISRQPCEPDFILCADESVDIRQALAGIKERGTALLNAAEKPDFPVVKKKRIAVYRIDATGMSLALPEKPEPCYALLGMLAKLCNAISMKAVRQVLEKQAVIMFDEGYKAVK